MTQDKLVLPHATPGIRLERERERERERESTTRPYTYISTTKVLRISTKEATHRRYFESFKVIKVTSLGYSSRSHLWRACGVYMLTYADVC